MAMAAWGQPEAPVGEAAPPETLEELEELRLTIIEEMNGIRNQLSGRKADIEQEAAASGSFDRYGKPMVSDPKAWADYRSWRARATAALRHKENELLDVKKTIVGMRAARGFTHEAQVLAVGSDPLEMLAALYGAARRLATRIGFDKMDVADQSVMDAVREFLQHRA